MKLSKNFSLYSLKGERKYLNQSERRDFYKAAITFKDDIKLFCLALYFSGARIREIYELTIGSIDHSNKTLIIESLKKRRRGVYREIPIPNILLDQFKYYIIKSDLDLKNNNSKLWSFSIRTANRYVKKVMNQAKIKGVKSSSKGLRHGFAVLAVSKVPITQVQIWLGHSYLQTTAIYSTVSGKEERELAKRLWVAP